MGTNRGPCNKVFRGIATDLLYRWLYMCFNTMCMSILHKSKVRDSSSDHMKEMYVKPFIMYSSQLTDVLRQCSGINQQGNGWDGETMSFYFLNTRETL